MAFLDQPDFQKEIKERHGKIRPNRDLLRISWLKKWRLRLIFTYIAANFSIHSNINMARRLRYILLQIIVF